MKNKTQLTANFSFNRLYDHPEIADLLKSDKPLIVYEDKNTLTDQIEYGIMEDNGEGIPAILNDESKKYHGWRGTLYEWSRHGLGLRKIKSVRHFQNSFGNDYLHVVFGPDLVPDLA